MDNSYDAPASAPIGPGPAIRELEAAVARMVRISQGPQAAARYLRSCGWSVDAALNALARRDGAYCERSLWARALSGPDAGQGE